MIASKKIRKAIQEVPLELDRIVRGQYPQFVRAARPANLGQEIPVFMFHSVTWDRFEQQLSYLRQNGYETVTLEQFISFLTGDYKLQKPSVLLTFDDGDKSWYEVAYPLLKKYEYQAVGFLASSFIKAAAEDGPWLSWPEIKEMEASGIMSFESHTAYHDQIFVENKVVDFFHPTYEQNPLGLDTPWTCVNGRYTNQLPLGTPIYSHISRLAGKRRFFEDEDLSRACQEWVIQQGGTHFFERPDWSKTLEKQYQSLVSRYQNHHYESEEQQQKTILDSLIQAKETIESNLGRKVHHLCYPWGSGGNLSVSLSQQAGYQSNFWVATPQRNINRPSDSPFFISRIKDDYIFRLPGESRYSLAKVFSQKLGRRVKKTHIY